jgi:hypothetical protein
MTAGREFRALEFPGGSTSDRAQRGLMLFFPSTSITVELWVRKDPANPGALLAILGCKSQTGSSRELVLWASETQVFLEIKAQKAYGAFCPLSVGVWAHYAFTWDNTQGTVECTKDGTFQNRQNNVATDLSFDSQISMMIGQDYENTLTPASSFAGGLSQLRIWNTVISNQQISYAMQKSYPEALIARGDFINMIAYYEFPQYFTGTDRSGKENHLTIVGRVETVLPDPVPTVLLMAYSEKALLVPPNQPSTGTKNVEIVGSAFGMQAYSGQGRGRHLSACEATNWISDTGVMLRVSAGTSASRTIILTVGIQANSITFAVSVDKIRLSSSRRSNVASSGAHSITVSGSGLGLRDHTGHMRVQGSSCEATLWAADSAVRSLMMISLGGTRRISITTGDRISTWSSVFSYDSRMGMHSCVGASNSPVTGSVSLTLTGAGFGMMLASAATTAGHTQAEASIWQSTTGIMIRVAHGIGGTRRHSVTAGVLPGTYTAGASFDAGKLNVHLNQELRNGPATGSTFVTVTGAGFGQRVPSSRSRHLGSAAESTKWTSGILIKK